MKTLAFFCVLMDQGCSFEAENMSGDADIFDCNEDSSSQNDEDLSSTRKVNVHHAQQTAMGRSFYAVTNLDVHSFSKLSLICDSGWIFISVGVNIIARTAARIWFYGIWMNTTCHTSPHFLQVTLPLFLHTKRQLGV
jgi:hypothetical protein